MAPFYEVEPTQRNRKLAVGETVQLSCGSKKARVEVVDDDILLVVPESGSLVYAGEVNKDGDNFEEKMPRIIERSTVLMHESVSAQISSPKIIWRKK